MVPLRIKSILRLNAQSTVTVRENFIKICKDRITGWDILTDIGKVTDLTVLFKDQPRLFGKYIKKIFLHRKSLIIK